jgi:c-di-GMP-binding flagellar brake protein YcgR
MDELLNAQSCWCGDLSRGGACMLSKQPLSLGRLIEVWFKLSDTLQVECEAEVVRRERDRMGIRFIAMDPFQAKQFEKLLARLQHAD